MKYFYTIILIISSLSATIYNVPLDVSTIQGAINFSANGDTVLVAPGTYYENIDYSGKEIIIASMMLLDGNEGHIAETIIDGNNNGTVVTFENDETNASILYGLSIRGGSGTLGNASDLGANGYRFAGGIGIFRSEPTISYCYIYDNIVSPTLQTESFGGGISMYGATWAYGIGEPVTYNWNPIIEYCKIYDNAANLGGGISVLDGIDPIIKNCLIKDNISTNGWIGGGIYSRIASPLIYRCIFKNNRAPSNIGGAIGLDMGGEPVILNCTFDNNNDAAIFMIGGSYPSIINSIFTNNTYNNQPGGDIFIGANNGTYDMYITYANNIFDLDYFDQIPSEIWEENANLIGGDLWGVDPLYIPESIDNDTYLLSSNSPALDAGRLEQITLGSSLPNFDIFYSTGGFGYNWTTNINPGSFIEEIVYPIGGTSWYIHNYTGLTYEGDAPDIGASEFDYNTPYITISDGSIQVDSDDDNVANPSELIEVNVIFENSSQLEITSSYVQLDIESSGIIFLEDECNISNFNSGAQELCTFELILSPLVPLGNLNLNFNILSNDNEGNQFNQVINNYILVSYDQEGFPFQMDNSKISSSAAIADINDDGDKDIIFSNYDGLLYALSSDGEDILEGFPFEAEDQILGSPAIADLDDDGEVEIIISSKDEHLYIINGYGEVVLDYDASYWLIGTPAIGNLDEDEELEIVFGSFSSSGRIHAINIDGSDVLGFPIDINERISVGASLADFNGDGLDDIVIGTENENLYLIYSDGTIADNFPILFDNKFKSAPSIIENDGSSIIIIPNRNRNLYGITGQGDILFEYFGDSYEWTEPAIIDLDEFPAIFIGSGDVLYGIDYQGNNLLGWPINLETNIIGGPVISDIDSDFIPEVIVTTETKINVFNLNGTPKVGYPIGTIFNERYSSSLVIEDIDLDGDLELISGTNQSGLFNIDIKSNGNSDGYWNMYRGNLYRNGLFKSQHELSMNQSVNLINKFNINNIYPNPFNASTKIEYSIPHLTDVNIQILDLKGAVIENLITGVQQQGIYTIDWNADHISSGIYFIKFKADKYKQLKKITIIK